MHPADGDWLWYVRDVHNDAQGRPQHVFTASAEVFAEANAPATMPVSGAAHHDDRGAPADRVDAGLRR